MIARDVGITLSCDPWGHLQHTCIHMYVLRTLYHNFWGISHNFDAAKIRTKVGASPNAEGGATHTYDINCKDYIPVQLSMPWKVLPL